jgi:acyl carrier protein
MAARLPDYMVPSTFVILDQIPQTATGKIDRRALPDPGKSRPDLDTPYAAPRTPVEAELAQIWSEVLSVDPLGIYDNFFDLGGHSLAATRIVSQVIKKFQLEIPLRSLFESPTVAEMAGVITQSQANKLDEVDLNRILAELEALPDDEGK